MALDFPAAPSVGQVYGNWQWSGTAWVGAGTAPGGDITSVTAGSGLSGGGTAGDVTLSLVTPVSIANGGSGAASAAAAPWLEKTGGTLSGALTVNGSAANPLQITSPASTDNFLRVSVAGGRSWSIGEYGGNGYFAIVDVTAGAQRMSIDSAGACANTTGTWSAISDERLKTNIEDYCSGLAEIVKLRPVTFGWRKKDYGPKVNYGLVAQEVEQVMPELVGENELDGEVFKTVDPGRLVFGLVNAVRELAAEVERLKRYAERSVGAAG